MSGFVPFRRSARFQARLSENADQAEREAVPDRPVADGAEQVEIEEGVQEVQAQPQEDVQALVAEARESGRDEAEAALAELRTGLEAERAALVCLMDSIDKARADWAREVRGQLGEVLVVGVRQIVSESATLQAEALKQRIAEVGERLIGEQQVLLRVRSEDVEAARALVGERAGWQVFADDSLTAGGCLAETDGGQIDATMGAAIAGLSGSVKDWVDATEGEEE